MTDTIEWLSRLIAFDTTSRNSNLELINHIEKWLRKHNIKSQIIHDPAQPKANLFATIPAQNGSTEGGVILSGHTDVVPVDGQQWSTNPFEAVCRDGKIFGRGACDMKGFIAAVLSLVPTFNTMNLNHPIHLAFSYDEEIGCAGAPYIIDEIKKQNIKPHACIVGEPTDMKIVVAHKGIRLYRCKVHGVAAHSSLTTKGCNAIEYAADLICFIRSLSNNLAQQGPFDSCFDVPFTTMTTNFISGGTANNIIPALCEFVFEIRNLPENHPNQITDQIKNYISTELLPKMKKENSSAHIQLDNIAGVPGFSNTDSSMTQLIQQMSDHKEKRKVAYATEAGLFQEAEIPTLLCGPGNIEQAHRPDEFVTLEQLEKCKKFLLDVAALN